ncbi:hypothetical protein HZA87_00150 [Candidatus Uhrbacteria bacterium]|nr:hypothetical protein [Candidatus Uhrbacteria bacterium]
MNKPVPEPCFPLTIHIDAHDIDWTHLVGVLDHVLTPDELPVRLGEQLMPILLWIQSHGQKEFVLGNSGLGHAPKNAAETLKLTAWWLEWNRRRRNARDHFECTHCGKRINVKTQGAKVDTIVYSCPDNTCPTWEMLSKVTGAPVLRIVGAAESA